MYSLDGIGEGMRSCSKQKKRLQLGLVSTVLSQPVQGSWQSTSREIRGITVDAGITMPLFLVFAFWRQSQTIVTEHWDKRDRKKDETEGFDRVNIPVYISRCTSTPYIPS